MATDHQTFSATIKKVGINPCVDLPARVSRALGGRGYIPVDGTLDGKPFLTNLVPLGGGRHRLFINGIMRTAAGVDVGDRVKVMLRADPKPRAEPMPALLAAALSKSSAATAVWKSLTPSRRKEIMRYLNSMKRQETLEKNVAKVMVALRKGVGKAAGRVVAGITIEAR